MLLHFTELNSQDFGYAKEKTLFGRKAALNMCILWRFAVCRERYNLV